MSVLPLRTGWEPGAGDRTFYPDDLPSDWQLGYFANEFRGVLLSAATWQAAGEGAARTWVNDTPDRFRFYLEADGAVPTERAVALAEALGPRFGGALGPLSVGVSDHHPWRPVLELRSSLVGGPAPSLGLAWPVPGPVLADLRTARAWLEQRVRGSPAGPVLILLGACPAEELRRWQTLIELLGLA